MAWSKEERWVRAGLPKTVNCVRIGDQYLGKLFSLVTHETVRLFPLSDANDFTKEAWIDGHYPEFGITTWEGHSKSALLKKGEYFMVLDAISLTGKKADKSTLSPNNQYFLFKAKWYWAIIYGGKFWMFETVGRIACIPRLP